jgi:dTDP-4-dehydrorhamnose 3,5-epimerase
VAEELAVHSDPRGRLYEIVRRDDPNYTQFGQVYVIEDARRGVVRAWHRHFKMDEWFSCVAGEALFVLHDPRTGEFSEHVLSAKKPASLWVPRLVFHGHQALTDDAVIVAICTEPYDPKVSDEERVSFDHFPGYTWSNLES